MASHEEFAGLVADVVGRYGYWPAGEPEPITSGTLNWNFRMATDGGVYFVRRYRDDLPTERILGEHQVTAWAAERGVPAPCPETLEGGRTLLELGGGRWALYPWVEGELVARGELTMAQARTLGALHGFTQATLAGHPLSEGATLEMRWSKEESQHLLGRVAEEAARTGAPAEWQAAIRQQRALLDQWDVLPPDGFASLPCQLLHGDFHDHQVLWQGDSVAALVDWEIWKTDPRVWELIRSLAFSRLFESPGMDAYLEGYRAFIQISEPEARLGMRMWWQSRVVGLWGWAAYFLQGNTRVSRFFPQIVAELRLLADDRWRSGIEDRFVAGVMG